MAGPLLRNGPRYKLLLIRSLQLLLFCLYWDNWTKGSCQRHNIRLVILSSVSRRKVKAEWSIDKYAACSEWDISKSYNLWMNKYALCPSVLCCWDISSAPPPVRATPLAIITSHLSKHSLVINVQVAYMIVCSKKCQMLCSIWSEKQVLKIKYCMRPPLRPVFDSLYRLSLTSLRLAGSWLQIWQNWLLIKFDPARSFPSNYLLAPAPQLFNPHHLNTTCGCYMRKLTTEHHIGTRNKI